MSSKHTESMVGEKDMQLQAYSRQLHEQTPFGRIIGHSRPYRTTRERFNNCKSRETGSSHNNSQSPHHRRQ